MKRLFVSSFTTLFMVGCVGAPAGDKPETADPVLDEKADSFSKPTDHGAIPFAQKQVASFGKGAQYHAWTFSLYGDASVKATTGYGGSGSPDTVLYLYKKSASGAWGSYLAKNDDVSRKSSYSQITKSLGAGDYRAIVKGYDNEKGKFAFTVACDGAGCQPPPPPAACLFGDTFGAIPSDGPVRITVRSTLTKADIPSLDGTAQKQIIAALHVSTHTDVTTVEEAFAAADQGEINFIAIYDEAGARTFRAVEYGAGDNSYGAIFADGSATPVANIHDGDLEACTVSAQQCILGSRYIDIAESDAYDNQVRLVLTASSTLSSLEKSQLLAAVQESYSDAKTVAQAFASVDGGEVNEVTVQDRATGKRFTAFEYGAGDNSYGAVFVYGTTTRAAAIHDGDFYYCSIFR